MSQSKGIVELYSDSGEITRYRKLSQRMPAFLAKYGPEQGYGTVTEVVDWLSLKPGLLRLYEIAIQAGHQPEAVGLPSLSAVNRAHVCRATLVDASKRVLGSATAAKHILDYKDLEVLETAARQRLLAALGFGGEVLDGDEAQDQRDQRLQPVTGTPAGEDGAATPSTTDEPLWPAGSAYSAPAAKQGDMNGGAIAGDEVTPPTEAVGEASSLTDDALEAAPPPSERPDESQATDDQALVMLKRQIAHLAKMRGVKVPAVNTRSEAQGALKQLLQTRAAPA